MKEKVEAQIKNTANRLICNLLDYADERKLCEHDRLETLILRGIPLEWLVESTIASLNTDEIHQLSILYGTTVSNVREFEMMRQNLYRYIREVLTVYFVTLCDKPETESIYEYADIEGYQCPEEELMPLFIPIVLLDIVFCEQNVEKRDRKKEMFIGMPCRATLKEIAIGLELDDEDEIDIEEWRSEARNFAEEKFRAEYERKRKVFNNIDGLVRHLDYF